MRKPDHIIILEDNEISMFLIQGVLAPFENEYNISYFTNEEETEAFLKTFPYAAETSINLFVSLGIVLTNHKFATTAKKLLLSTSSRLFLLSSMPVPEEKMQELRQQGFICCIEKPLSEQKFMDALNFQSVKNGF